MVQPEAHPQEELDVEVLTRNSVAHRCLRGSRMEGSELVREAVELLFNDPTTESKIPRSIYEVCAGSAAENFNFPGDWRFNRNWTRRSSFESLWNQLKAAFCSSSKWSAHARLHNTTGIGFLRTFSIILHSNVEILSRAPDELIASNFKGSTSV